LLGIQINYVQQEQKIYLNQSKYIEGILRQFAMVENKPIQIPFMTNYKLLKDMGLQNDANLEAMRVISFQNVIGSFMYMQWYTQNMILHKQWGL
jgi:hypothetical protein